MERIEHATPEPSGRPPAEGLFILGTDTDVGKSYLGSCWVRQALECHVAIGAYKPVASGVSPWGVREAMAIPDSQLDDGWRYHRALGGRYPLEWINPQRFPDPLAPEEAAKKIGQHVDESLLLAGAARWSGRCDFLFVEGAGGVWSPISRSMTNADLAERLGYPVILVADNRVGAVHQTLASLAAIATSGLAIQAVVLNSRSEATDPLLASNQRMIEEHSVRYFLNPPEVVGWSAEQERCESALLIGWMRRQSTLSPLRFAKPGRASLQ
jgi:dethiobiotin synthetase